MSIELFAAFCVTETVLCFTPGPAVLLVTSVALRRGVRGSAGAALGIVGANILYFALSATGVAAVLVASRELFMALKWIGALYLVWLGLRMILVSNTSPDRPVRPGLGFVHGLMVQGANPKAIVFFIAFLPQFLDATLPLTAQLMMLGGASVVIELGALFTYAWVARGAGRLIGPGLARAAERLGGGLLVAAGARLAAMRQSGLDIGIRG